MDGFTETLVLLASEGLGNNDTGADADTRDDVHDRFAAGGIGTYGI